MGLFGRLCSFCGFFAGLWGRGTSWFGIWWGWFQLVALLFQDSLDELKLRRELFAVDGYVGIELVWGCYGGVQVVAYEVFDWNLGLTYQDFFKKCMRVIES